MMLKLIGGILIIAASGILGMAAANRYSQRPKDIRKFRGTLQMLETEILFGGIPLPQAFYHIASKSEGRFRNFYSSVAEELQATAAGSLELPWVKAVQALGKEASLNPADRELIADFGKVLGSSDREDQKKHFELLYIQLRQHEEQAEEDRHKNERMYRSLGFLSGIVIFILLV
jgi:stage III sporulation protein AB